MIRIGKIVAAHGLQGDVIMTHNTGNGKWLKKGGVLHIAIRKGSAIPHFIIEVKRADAKEAVIHFEDTDKVEVAKALIGKEVFAEQKDVALVAQDSPLAWIGFDMIDTEKGKVGTISDVFQTAHQWLAQIMIDGKEALIPLVEQMIKKVDVKAKTVTIELPEGLLEIYTG